MTEHPSTGRDREAMTRRTYYFSAGVADDLAAAVARLHHGSHGRVTKAAALEAIITAGIERLGEVERRLQEGTPGPA